MKMSFLRTIFWERMKAEELAEKASEGIVFSKCADGDHILFCENGRLVRFRHEEPKVIRSWDTLASQALSE